MNASVLLRYVILMVAILFLSGCVSMDAPVDRVEPFSDKPVVLFILDTSGSMDELIDGETKLSSAKSEIVNTVNQINKDKYNTALITFSEREYCESELSVEPGGNRFDKLSKIIAMKKAYGRTPLADAIRLSGEVLKNIDKKMVILVSDGQETCTGDPVKEAKYLSEQYGININVQVIGYAVDDASQQQLKKIADLDSDWKYHKAEDADQVARAIDRITKKAALLDPIWLDSKKSSIQFETGSADMKDTYMDEIEKLFEYLRENDKRIKIIGHTDSAGSSEWNKRLSVERAKIVKHRLNAMGISDERMEVFGMGDESPISTNSTSEGRQLNRRVEIEVLESYLFYSVIAKDYFNPDEFC